MADAATSTCVILQPSYIPWRGYFDLIARADTFVFYDDVQYDKHGWRNRNRVKTASGTQWLTIPVLSKGNVEDGLLLKDARIAWTTSWAKKHLATLRQSYAKSPFFKRYEPLLESFYAQHPDMLCDFTIDTTRALAKELGITRTRFLRSSELAGTGERTERLIRILRAVSATRYVSGPSARDYLDEALFKEARIDLEYIVYDYPPYEQLHPPYDPQVTILDLLFMKGEDAASFIRSDA
jgi:WbqC-like protein family